MVRMSVVWSCLVILSFKFGRYFHRSECTRWLLSLHPKVNRFDDGCFVLSLHCLGKATFGGFLLFISKLTNKGGAGASEVRTAASYISNSSEKFPKVHPSPLWFVRVFFWNFLKNQNSRRFKPDADASIASQNLSADPHTFLQFSAEIDEVFVMVETSLCNYCFGCFIGNITLRPIPRVCENFPKASVWDFNGAISLCFIPALSRAICAL